MRLSWYSDTGIAVFSIWQGGTCTGTFRLPVDDLSRIIDSLRRGLPGEPALQQGTGAIRQAAPSGQHQRLAIGTTGVEPFTGAMTVLTDEQAAAYGLPVSGGPALVNTGLNTRAADPLTGGYPVYSAPPAAASASDGRQFTQVPGEAQYGQNGSSQYDRSDYGRSDRDSGYRDSRYRDSGYRDSEYRDSRYNGQPEARAGQGYAAPAYDTRAHDEPGYDERGYGERGYGEQRYGEPGYGERGYGEPGYGEQRYDEQRYDPQGYAAPGRAGQVPPRPDLPPDSFGNRGYTAYPQADARIGSGPYQAADAAAQSARQAQDNRWASQPPPVHAPSAEAPSAGAGPGGQPQQAGMAARLAGQPQQSGYPQDQPAYRQQPTFQPSYQPSFTPAGGQPGATGYQDTGYQDMTRQSSSGGYQAAPSYPGEPEYRETSAAPASALGDAGQPAEPSATYGGYPPASQYGAPGYSAPAYGADGANSPAADGAYGRNGVNGQPSGYAGAGGTGAFAAAGYTEYAGYGGYAGEAARTGSGGYPGVSPYGDDGGRSMPSGAFPHLDMNGYATGVANANSFTGDTPGNGTGYSPSGYEDTGYGDTGFGGTGFYDATANGNGTPGAPRTATPTFTPSFTPSAPLAPDPAYPATNGSGEYAPGGGLWTGGYPSAGYQPIGQQSSPAPAAYGTQAYQDYAQEPARQGYWDGDSQWTGGNWP